MCPEIYISRNTWFTLQQLFATTTQRVNYKTYPPPQLVYTNNSTKGSTNLKGSLTQGHNHSSQSMSAFQVEGGLKKQLKFLPRSLSQ